MSQQNLLLLNPITAAKTALKIQQPFEFTNLSQLNSCIAPGNYTVELEAQFSLQQYKALLTGHLTGDITLLCQRTLDQFNYPVSSKIQLGFVTDDRLFKGFPDHYEAYTYQNEQINLQALVQQEILLAVPMIPKKSPEHVGNK